LTSRIISAGIFSFSIDERFDHSGNIFADTEINQQRQVKPNCKPALANTRTSIVTSNVK